jgi:arginine N-succinyltransferase
MRPSSPSSAAGSTSRVTHRFGKRLAGIFLPLISTPPIFSAGWVTKGFIADLMPDHPLYVPLLPAAAQEVIGQVHTNTEPALRLLLSEGFARTNEVDIFDAGPLLRAATREIRTVRTMRTGRVQAIDLPAGSGLPRLFARTSPDFGACLGSGVEGADGTLSIDAASAAALGLGPGDRITHAPLR